MRDGLAIPYLPRERHRLIGPVDANAHTTAAGIGRALGGAARMAMYSALYSAR